MTKEQAIEILEKEKAYMLSHGGDRQAEALEVAIKALEQEPCEDAVSRAEVVDELNRLGRNAFKDDTDYDNFFALLDSLPSVTPTTCIAKISFDKEAFQKIVDEKVQELVTHGTCKDCSRKRLDKEESEEVGAEKYFCPVVCGYVDETPDFYCEKFEKGGNENVSS